MLRMRRTLLGFLVGVATLALFASGCSLKTMAVRTIADVLEDGVATFESEPDVALARESIGSQIKLLETLHRADPSNERVLLALCRSFGSYAFGFLEWEAEQDPLVRDRAQHLYRRGAEYGLALLERRFGKGLREAAERADLKTWSEKLEKANQEDVPAMFWTGYAWAGSIQKSPSSPASLAELPLAVALVERVLELQPGYHYGAPHLFFGVYYAARPRLLGGNPTTAAKHFENGLRASDGKYLMAKYLRARVYTTQVQDLALFRKDLKEILDAPEDLLSEQQLTQQIAKSWAGELLKRQADYFAEAE